MLFSYSSFYNTDNDQCAVEMYRAELRGGQARQLPGVLRHHWNNMVVVKSVTGIITDMMAVNSSFHGQKIIFPKLFTI
jgi:hypothetical protein